MAKLYVTEYSELAKDTLSRDMMAAKEPSLVEQTPITISGSSAQSAAFSTNTNLIRVHTDAICSVLVAIDPTATANHKRMAANQTEYFGVRPGHKIAVITNS